MAKIKIAVIFGGKSSEHEISLISAKNVMDALDKEKYDIFPIGITKDGDWFFEKDYQKFIADPDDARKVKLVTDDAEKCALANRILTNIENDQDIAEIDAAFPVLHGTNGEDGTMQGLLKLANIPFVGPGVLGSAIGMDKDPMKRLLRDAGVPISKFVTFSQNDEVNFEKAQDELGLPMFIKPANSGSSVGINKAHNKEEFEKFVTEAFKYDSKIIIEEMIRGREIEVSVLGNENPIASLPGQVIPHHEFYDYEAKYIDENGASFEIPVKLPEDQIELIQETAVNAFKTLCCEGMARVDGFLTEDDQFFINEINTIPGFTKISMYPKLWAASGLPYPKLLDKLVELAIERFEREKKIETNYNNIG